MLPITAQVYMTRVVDGIVQSDSVPTTLTVTDADADGLISAKEWAAATGGVIGHNGGADEALWRGDKTGNFRTGTLYGRTCYQAGDDARPALRPLKHNFRPVDPGGMAICFAAGTLIATPDGPRAVETIRAGDLVLTLDAGAQPVVWAGSRHLDAEALDRAPNLRPIRIAAGALGDGLPLRDLTVSPQHRILMRHIEGDAGQGVLVAARHLAECARPGADVLTDVRGVTYCHLALAGHAVLLAEGAPAESLYTGPQALRALSRAQRQDLAAVFPALARGENPMTPARPFARRKDVLRARRLSA